METPKRLTKIMVAALEDAFDVEKSAEDMRGLKESITKKMDELIVRRQNNEDEGELAFFEEEQFLNDAMKEIEKEFSSELIKPRKKRERK